MSMVQWRHRALPGSPAGYLRSCRAYSRVAGRIAIKAQQADLKPLVVVGSVNADIMLQVPRFASPGETLPAKSMQTLPGGKGANQAAAAAMLEHPTIFIGQVGTDANAQLVRSALSDCGVDISHLREVKGPTGSAIISVDPQGENIIVIVGGANTSKWDFSQETQQARSFCMSVVACAVMKNAGMVLLQREIPEEVNTQVAQIAQGSDVPVLLDCGGVEGPISPDLLRCLSCISPNETELARLTDMPTDSSEQVQVAAAKLQEQGVKSVLAKLGSKGSLLVKEGGQVLKQDILKADKVVDTTGAGDCFTGAVAVALLEGLSEQEALRFAAAAASRCVSKPGAMPSMPGRQEVDELLKS
eukprot:jgi/Astpho2/203/Aster-x0426